MMPAFVAEMRGLRWLKTRRMLIRILVLSHRSKKWRGDTEAPLEKRAESSFMMGQCLKAQKDFAGAAFLFLETHAQFS